MPPMNRIETKTATIDRFIDSSVKPTSRAADQRRGQRRLARLDVAVDVLQHDDRVVHDQAGRDDERHQRQVVEREAEEIHHRTAADQGHRHRRHRDHRRAQPPQEQQDDENDETDGDEQRMLRFAQRRADGRRAVARDVQGHARRQEGAQRRQLGHDAVDGRDDVGLYLTAHHQEHRRPVVEVAGVVAVFDAAVDPRHVREPDRRAVAIRDDDRLVLLGRHQLVAGLNLPAAVRCPRPCPWAAAGSRC